MTDKGNYSNEVLQLIDSKYAILNVLPIGNFILDFDFKVLFWNDYMVQYFGIKREEIVGLSVYDVFPGFEKFIYQSPSQAIVSI